MLDKLTQQQVSQIRQHSLQLIEDLPELALNELLGGYEGDFDKLALEMFSQVDFAFNFGHSLDTEKLSYLENLEFSMDKSLKKYSYNYFKTTVLPGFKQGWRNLEWGNLVQLYPWSAYLAARSHGKSFEFCYSFPIWRLYSYDIQSRFEPVTIDNQNRKETLFVTNVEKLGTEHSGKIIEEIRFNDVLKEKLNPNNKANLGATKITTETGSMLHIRGLFGFQRGLHTGSVVCDDLPDESSLYSHEQRLKVKERLYGSIQPIVEPGGYFLVSGTPYHEADIYSELRKDPNFKMFEYPCVFPDGRLLSPDRFTIDKLNEVRESVGSIVFTREYLVTPMTSDASIFPREFLERSIIGMENVNFANTIEEFPFKLTQVVLACDFAISGKAGSDYSVFSVWGKDSNENFYLVALWRKQSGSYTEQVNQIVSMNQRFRPNKIICETNGFQKIMLSLVKSRGIKNVTEFVTESKTKKDSYEGVPSISAMFERYQIKVPYAEGESRNLAEKVFSEFTSIGYIEEKGKLESISENDDIVMSSWMGITHLRENTKKFKAYSI